VSNERKKYLFDLNNFDSGRKPEVDPDLPPPPPVFSLDEMESAEREGYLKGREEAFEEARVSREQYIASQVSGLNDQIRSLVLAEQMREKRFEEEALHIARTIFSRVFPSFSAKHSIDEVIQVIRDVVDLQDRAKIIIDVPNADLEDIRAQISLLIESSNGRLVLNGRDDLNAGSCRMHWENGGALREQDALVGAIVAAIEDMLAPLPQKSQNNESGGVENPLKASDTPVHDEENKGEDQ
jgi:flagellar assembly protein FliH